MFRKRASSLGDNCRERATRMKQHIEISKIHRTHILNQVFQYRFKLKN